MTDRKHFKRRVRARMAKTSESYSTARHHVVQQAVGATSLDPDYLKGITGMSNEAVHKKTGRDWNQWIGVLDAARADRMKHPEIAKYLNTRHRIPGWWAQTITVGYERVRGMRAVNQKADGFSVNKSATLALPISVVFQAWNEESERTKWLDEEIVVRKSTPNKSMRITWSDERSHVAVYFYSKGEVKSQVSLQHTKLKDAREVEAFRSFWTEKLADLKRFLS